jgi:class 3 adenylate cyclase
VDETEAKRKLNECLERFRCGLYSPESWITAPFELRPLPNGDWLATRPQLPSEGIVLTENGDPVPFFGALGKLVPTLGLPISRELLLGSAQRGRYQIYERGPAVWEEFQHGGNLGYPVASWSSPEERARKCRALVAFFDLRGFTTWSGSRATAQQIQDVVLNFESAFQDAFSGKWCSKLFAKGTGDGFMVISEEGWTEPASKNFEGEHGRAFCRACAETVINGRRYLPQELAIGCGITLGEITQFYVLGRPDYAGPAVNEAAKIQTVAYDEICIAKPVLEHLNIDETALGGKLLPGKGIRVAPEKLAEFFWTRTPNDRLEKDLRPARCARWSRPLSLRR